jgi:hypothetical protein
MGYSTMRGALAIPMPLRRRGRDLDFDMDHGTSKVRALPRECRVDLAQATDTKTEADTATE